MKAAVCTGLALIHPPRRLPLSLGYRDAILLIVKHKRANPPGNPSHTQVLVEMDQHTAVLEGQWSLRHTKHILPHAPPLLLSGTWTTRRNLVQMKKCGSGLFRWLARLHRPCPCLSDSTDLGLGWPLGIPFKGTEERLLRPLAGRQ